MFELGGGEYLVSVTLCRRNSIEPEPSEIPRVVGVVLILYSQTFQHFTEERLKIFLLLSK